jgi:hypothetical protein
MTKKTLGAFGLGLAMALAACGDGRASATDLPALMDLGARSDLSGDLAGVCTTLSLDAVPEVTPIVSAGTAPSAKGGTIVPGTYQLTSATIFASDPSMAPPPTPFSSLLRFQGMAFEETDSSASKPIAGTFSAAANTLTLTVSCGGVGGVAYDYTATTQSLTLIDREPTYTTVQHFALQ